ncbi:MAG: hypothetical protein QOF56_842 [Acidobacteriaceae bacterium]|nr:hypothetical protein [Acidobacteriaceae bacterium]
MTAQIFGCRFCKVICAGSDAVSNSPDEGLPMLAFCVSTASQRRVGMED